jgi:hypothetical protein
MRLGGSRLRRGSVAMLLLVWLAPVPAHADLYAGISLKGGVAGAKYNKPNRALRYDPSGGIAGHLGWTLAGRFLLGGQLELLYTPRGTRVVFSGVPSGNSLQHYYDVAITVRPEVQLDPVRLYLMLGASRNHLTSAHDWSAINAHFDVTHLVRETDVALRAGIGVVLPLPRQSLPPFHRLSVFLEACHDRGMIDFDIVDRGFRNRTSSLLVGLTYGLPSR